MNRWPQGMQVIMSNEPEGFVNPNVDPVVSLNPSVVYLLVWVNVDPTESQPTYTYEFGVDPLILNPATGFFKRKWDSTGQRGSTISYQWSGDPDGTPMPVCQAVSEIMQFLVV